MPMSDDEKERNFYIDNNSIFASFFLSILFSAQHCLCIIHYIYFLFPTTQTESAATPFRKEHTFSMWKTAVKYIYIGNGVEWDSRREKCSTFCLLALYTFLLLIFSIKKNLYFIFIFFCLKDISFSFEMVGKSNKMILVQQQKNFM